MRTSRSYLRQLLIRPVPRQRWLALLMLVSLTVFLILHSSDHSAASPFAPPWDKVAHFLFFAGLATLAWIVSAGRGVTGAVGVLLVAAAIGAADELTQGANPVRVMDGADFAADLAGAASAALVLSIASHRVRRQVARNQVDALHPGRRPLAAPSE